MQLEKARNSLRWAVEKEEALRAKHSITERLREAKAKEAANQGDATDDEAPDPDTATDSTEEDGEGELAGIATKGKITAD